MSCPVTISCIQAEIIPGDPAENMGRAKAWIDRCPSVEDQPHFILFPEYFLQGLTEQGAQLAQPLDGPFGQAMIKSARDTGATIFAGLLESSPDPNRPYNAIGIWGPEGVMGAYRKTHLYDLGDAHPDWARECRAFLPGDRLGFFTISGINLGIMTCADGLVVDVPRAIALRGADLILYPNGRVEVPLTHAEFHAESNGIPLAVCNGWGPVGIEDMEGGSRVVNHFGVLLATGDAEPGIVTGELDISEGRAYRRTFWPLQARRPEIYGPLTIFQDDE